MSMTIATNGKIQTGKQEVVNQFDISEKLNPYLNENDRSYIGREGQNIAVLAIQEASIEKEVAALQAALRNTPEYKKLQEKRLHLKRTRILIEDKTTKVMGVVECALEGTKRGARLVDKLDELITMPAPKALKEKN